ncbi:hypothetical protein AB0J38_19415 [Streptomyces sp. NPDC050095]|uniref:hypothetical protein n=1 Tax=unclassified Streptomyces TaxID=2593676 RepID=UPI00342D7E82
MTENTAGSGKEFEIPREFEVGASPEQVWDAVTNGTAGWLWPRRCRRRRGARSCSRAG